MDELLQEFIAETRETLEALSGEIVAWEASPDDRVRLDAIFRFVHTVKGSCGFLDLPRLERLSHAAEDVLADVREGRRAPDRALVNAVLAIVDRIGEVVEAIDAGHAQDDTGEEQLIAALKEGAEVVAQPLVTAPQRASQRSVRLNVDLLDRMMGGMSDMVLARNELARRLREVDLAPGIEAALERLSTSVADMRDTVTRTRMQKIDALFSALPRMVRDTAALLGKSVTLRIEGGDVELDREMIEVMRDPLMHMVRNAIDHGLETPAERRSAGKRESGRLSVCARQAGNQILIELADDGRGIDVDRLVRKVAETGRRTEAELRALSERARTELIFEAGLSSREDVTAISGRGVGMDVVRAAIDQIGGRIDLDNAPGKGLRIAIQVPLTLSIISTIVVGVAGERFAIPRQAIEEIVTERGAMVRVDRLGGSGVVAVRERRMPLVDLGELLQLEARGSAPMLAIVSATGGSYALAVDAVLDTEELVVRPGAPAIMATGLYAGMTLPDTGRPMLLLDCNGIAAAAGLRFDRLSETADGEAADEEREERPAALLFVDLDGHRRLMPLAAVDRIERTHGDAVREVAGAWRLAIDGRLLPVTATARVNADEEIAVLRLTDGQSERAYAARAAIDIVDLPDSFAPAVVPGPVAGAVLLGGEQIELIDAHWLFSTSGNAAPTATPPLCLLSGDANGWLATFVRPMLEQAGYRVATRLAPGDTPAVVLADDATTAAANGTAPVIHLRADRVGGRADSIYRYDRHALLEAVAARTGAGRRA